MSRPTVVIARGYGRRATYQLKMKTGATAARAAQSCSASTGSTCLGDAACAKTKNAINGSCPAISNCQR